MRAGEAVYIVARTIDVQQGRLWKCSLFLFESQSKCVYSVGALLRGNRYEEGWCDELITGREKTSHR